MTDDLIVLDRPHQGAVVTEPRRRGRRADSLHQVPARGMSFRVSVRHGTDPEKLPLVLCNGIGASLEVLQPFVDALPKELTVVRFDVPGVGGSPAPALPYTYVSMASALGEVLRRLGFDRVDVLGMSWGGGVAQQFALQNRRRCRRMVLVATATGAIMVPASPRVLSKMMTPRRYSDRSYANQIAAEIYGGSLREHSDVTADLLQRHLRLGSRVGYMYQLLAISTWTTLPFLPLIRQQALIIAGTDDPIIPVANSKILNCLLPRAKVHLYDDGHLALITSPELLSPVITEFLDEP